VTEAQAREAQGKPGEAAGLYTQALDEFLHAERLNVLDGEPFLHHAALRETLWDRIRAQGTLRDGEVQELQIHEQIALLALENALKIRPRWTAVHARLGILHRKFARFYQDLSNRGDLYRQQAEIHRRLAVEHSLRATELYPTRAEARYWAARALDEGPPLADAKDHYAAALRFSDLAVRERLERLQLSPFQKARALVRLDRKDDAVHLLRTHFSQELLRTNPNPLHQRQAVEALLGHDQSGRRIREFVGDEYDELMKPVIDGVLLDILAALPKP